MAASRKFDEDEARKSRPLPRHGATAPPYDAVHDIREGRPTELGASGVDEESASPEIESEAARQERLAASPEAAAEEARAAAGPASARSEALAASPEEQAEEADRLLDGTVRSQDERPVGSKEE
jgi:hypothetical protein